MVSDFPRILTLLRKENGITQKRAAADLGVSQALLSHYEKGIRECGLEFVVRAAEYYNVSCDYLMGCSPDRSGLVISVDEMPDGDERSDGHYKGSVLPTLNKKLLTNSLNVLFGILQKCPDKTLISEISGYLMTAVYKMFRLVYGASSQNIGSMFTLSATTYSKYCNAEMEIGEAKTQALLSGERVGDQKPIKGVDQLTITTENLSEDYPLAAPSLFNLIKSVEQRINK